MKIEEAISMHVTVPRDSKCAKAGCNGEPIWTLLLKEPMCERCMMHWYSRWQKNGWSESEERGMDGLSDMDKRVQDLWENFYEWKSGREKRAA